MKLFCVLIYLKKECDIISVYGVDVSLIAAIYALFKNSFNFIRISGKLGISLTLISIYVMVVYVSRRIAV